MATSKAASRLRRILRPEPPLNQRKLADELGVTQQAISSWLRGISRPEGKERREKIAELTGIAPEEWDEPAGADDSGAHAALDVSGDNAA